MTAVSTGVVGWPAAKPLIWVGVVVLWKENPLKDAPGAKAAAEGEAAEPVRVWNSMEKPFPPAVIDDVQPAGVTILLGRVGM